MQKVFDIMGLEWILSVFNSVDEVKLQAMNSLIYWDWLDTGKLEWKCR